MHKGWRRATGHEERGIFVGVADGDVAETVNNLVVVEDVVCYDECGYELGEIDGYHVCGWD